MHPTSVITSLQNQGHVITGKGRYVITGIAGMSLRVLPRPTATARVSYLSFAVARTRKSELQLYPIPINPPF